MKDYEIYFEGLDILKKYDNNPEEISGWDGGLLWEDIVISEKFSNISKRDKKRLDKLGWWEHELNEWKCPRGDSQGR